MPTVSEEFDGADGEELDAQERRVRDLLRGSADVGPMPADVVARLDAALLAARRTAQDEQPGTPVASLTERRRSSWRTRVPRVLAAAAGVAVVGGGALLVGLQGTPGADSGSSSAAGGGSVAAASAEEVPPSAQVLQSGRDYADAAAVRDLGEDLLGQDPAGTADRAAPQGRADDATPGAGSTGRKPTMLNAPQPTDGPTDGPTTPPATGDDVQRATAEQALACTKQLGVTPDSVLAVEIASWQGRPAAFVVHATPGDAEVVVVALGCTPGDPALSTVPVP
ncbi:hypothetical protein AB2L27_16970 [Kineococcus sp. LSe6-4]|uniref:Uncharacterized protein n=1 Tax=Kineococcus halophytocola TaxID=3234027 RepID=A0ABV4H4F9_9ACTN